ncbi:MAG: hypothetical protein KAV01_05840, partial [Candidatus Lokiarchaeota archaeon]|nr:hypothetical protein [Candidatus Lokiarchaeota archaeon]
DHFYLLFEINNFNDTIALRLSLSQYDTTVLMTNATSALYKAPSPGLSGPLVLGLAIGIPVAAGVIVLIYILKKKGRILTKHPT